MDYIVKRSDRCTLSVRVDDDSNIIVRAGRRTSQALIDDFVRKSAPFIEKRLRENEVVDRTAERMGGAFTDREIRDMKDKARAYFAEKAALYADRLGVSYSGISIRTQTTLWGSCSPKGLLSFNCLLMEAPEFAAESVAAHEVCHLRHRNHGKAFYSDLHGIFPEYDKARLWLRQNGRVLIRRYSLYLKGSQPEGSQ
ncbi:MAG: M48 family metallopeptidase [Clostridia bacterium]|nr:M48 family metallopeptidase [Clostridia bacterium]